MKMIQATAACLLLLGGGACGDRGGNRSEANGGATNAGGTATNTGNAGNGSAAAFCQFTRDQVRNFRASISQQPPDPGRLLVVTGEAHVENPRYRAQLSVLENNGGVLRLWLTQAEASGPAPADGWHALRHEVQNPGAITRVVIWCDHDNPELVSLTVETPR